MNKKLLAIAALAAIATLTIGQGAGPQGGGFGPPQGGPGGRQGGPGMGPGGGLQGPRLLLNPSVQKELKLTDDQKQQLGKIIQQGGRGQGGPGGPGGPPPDGQGGGQGGPPPDRQGGQGGQGGFGPPPDQGGQGRGRGGPGGPGGPGGQQNKELEAKVKKILSESQYKRYQEIDLQVQGATAIMRPEVAEKLNVTEDQREQIREIMEASREQMRSPMGQDGERPDPQAMRAQMEKNKEALNKKILAILSSSQKSTWQSMLGTPFKLEMLRPQGGPGGFGGPGGPGGGGQVRGGNGGGL